MIDGCRSLTSLDVSNFNTAKVKFGEYMFNKCSILHIWKFQIIMILLDQ